MKTKGYCEECKKRLVRGKFIGFLKWENGSYLGFAKCYDCIPSLIISKKNANRNFNS